MKVYVSSESPVKHDAVKAAFARLGRKNTEIIAVPMPSGVNEQPKSMDETYEGALNRHLQLVKELGNKPGCYLVTTRQYVLENALYNVNGSISWR